MCLFEFVRVEGGVKFMKHYGGGGASYESLGNWPEQYFGLGSLTF
jgi:hypothetical protein